MVCRSNAKEWGHNFRYAPILQKEKEMKKWQLILLIALMVIGIYGCVRCIIDPTWYYGKSLVPEWVTQEEFWAYVTGGAK